MEYVGNHFYSHRHLNFSKIVGTSWLCSSAKKKEDTYEFIYTMSLQLLSIDMDAM